MILRYLKPGSTISQFLDAKIRLRNRAEPGTFDGILAWNYETGIGGSEAGNIVGGESEGGLINCLASDLRGQWA